MKKTIYILATVLALVLSACTPDPISENAVFLTEEAVAQIIPEVFPLKHRMELLLKSLQSNDSYFLSSLYPIVQHVRQQSPETRIDFGKLLEDLLNWENPEHDVQKRWTKTIAKA